ncbi:MAG: ATP-binding protein [Acidimicrobiales bacterium]
MANADPRLSVDDPALTDDWLEAVMLEDDDLDAEVLSRLLERAWHGRVHLTRFVELGELEEGIAGLDPAVVFVDLSLPDESGIEVVRRAVLCTGGAPVVVLTGNVEPSIPVLALEAGAQDYLAKGSFSVDVLARTLRYAIARAGADREIRRIACDLSALNSELDQYAGIVAHDLRAPIRTARLFADRMIAATREGRDASTMAQALDASLERSEVIIGRLLRLATLRDDVIEPVEETLGSIVGDIRVDLLADIQANGVELRCLVDGPILADRVLVRELLRNLVQNSIRYRSPRRDPEVLLSITADRSCAELTVSDNGVGIDAEHRERVFRLFERLETDGENPGYGFGLAFCRRIVQLHGGSIRIGDNPAGPGTTVTVVLPSS